MTDFDPNKNQKFDKKIVLDYPRVTVNKNEAEVPNDKRSPFTLLYQNSSSENNIFLTEGNISTNYRHNKIYITRLIHNNILNITTNDDNIIGEMIIEHSSDDNKLFYSCYLLKKSSVLNNDENDIDKILAIKDNDAINIDFTFNSISPTTDTKGILYESDSNKVCIYTTPIFINRNSEEKISNFVNVTQLFPSFPQTNKYFTIPNNYISIRDAEEIYIDCSPTGVSEDEVDFYNVPINSKMISQTQESDLMKTTVNYGMFLLALLISYVTVPLCYKHLIIDGSALAYDSNIKKRFERIRASDILLTIITFFFIIVPLISTGTATGDYHLVSVGVFMFVFYILSVGLIRIKKMDPEFMTTNIKGKLKVSDPDSNDAKSIDPLAFDELIPTISAALSVIISSDNLSAFVALLTVVLAIVGTLVFTGGITGTTAGNIIAAFGGGLSVLVAIVIGFKKKIEAQTP